jgi:hypothetical protein
MVVNGLAARANKNSALNKRLRISALVLNTKAMVIQFHAIGLERNARRYTHAMT